MNQFFSYVPFILIALGALACITSLVKKSPLYITASLFFTGAQFILLSALSQAHTSVNPGLTADVVSGFVLLLSLALYLAFLSQIFKLPRAA